MQWIRRTMKVTIGLWLKKGYLRSPDLVKGETKKTVVPVGLTFEPNPLYVAIVLLNKGRREEGHLFDGLCHEADSDCLSNCSYCSL